MFNCVKGLSKVQFQVDYFIFALLALVDELKASGYTILYCSRFNEPILICMKELKNDLLQSICKNFCQKLDVSIQKRNGLEVINCFWINNLGDKGDEGSIDALKVHSAIKKILAKFIKILFNERPTFLHKKSIEHIQARGLVQLQMFNDVINFLSEERSNGAVQIHCYRG